jgi:hypothetical protein
MASKSVRGNQPVEKSFNFIGAMFTAINGVCGLFEFNQTTDRRCTFDCAAPGFAACCR